jgi:hypothetical protein
MHRGWAPGRGDVVMRWWGYLGWGTAAGVLLCGGLFLMSRVAEVSGYCTAKNRMLPEWELIAIGIQRMADDQPESGMKAEEFAKYPNYLTEFMYPGREGPSEYDLWKRSFSDEYVVGVTVRTSADRFPTVYLDECGREVLVDPWFGGWGLGPMPPDMPPGTPKATPPPA